MPSKSTIAVRLGILVPLTVYYYDALLVSVENSTMKAWLIITALYVSLLIDLEDLAGQPEGNDHHHD